MIAFLLRDQGKSKVKTQKSKADRGQQHPARLAGPFAF
jgi:hypothetical protein